MRLHRDQSHHEERCLHKRRKAKCHDLLAPTCESLGHSSRKAEEIQTADSDLREQDAPSLDICKEAFDHAVAQADEDEEIEQDIVLPDDRRLVNRQYIQSQVLNVEIPDTKSRFGKGEGTMSVDGELVSRTQMMFALVDP